MNLRRSLYTTLFFFFVITSVGNTEIPTDGIVFPISNGRFFGLIDRNGNVIVEPSYGDVSVGYFDGQSKRHVGQDGAILVDQNRWVYVGKSGRKTLEPPTATAPRILLNVGNSLFAGFSKEAERDSHGLVPDFVVDPLNLWNGKFFPRGEFGDGLVPVFASGKFGFANRSGKVVIQPTYDEARRFSESRAAVRIGERWGYIGLDGNDVVAAELIAASSFDNGVALVCRTESPNYVLIDRDGSVKEEFKFPVGELEEPYRSYDNKETADFRIGRFSAGTVRYPISDKMPISDFWGYLLPNGTWFLKTQIQSDMSSAEFSNGLSIDGYQIHYRNGRKSKVVHRTGERSWVGFRYGLCGERGGSRYIDSRGKTVWKR